MKRQIKILILALVVVLGLPSVVLAADLEFVGSSNKIGRLNIHNHPVEEVVEGPGGSLWLLTRGGGFLVKEKGADWREVNANASKGYLNNFPQDLAFGQGGKQYIAYLNGLVEKRADGSFVHQRGVSSPLPADEVIALEADGQGGMWYAVRWYGISHQNKDGQVKNYTTKNSNINSDYVRDITMDKKSGLWLTLQSSFSSGQFGGLSYLSKDGVFTNYRTANSPLVTDQVKALMVASDGSLWVGGVNGLNHYDQGKWKTYDKRNTDLRFDDIRAFAEDKDGNIWLATFGNGLAKIDKAGQLTAYRRGDIQLASNDVLQVFIDPDNRLYAITTKGVSSFNLVKGQDTDPSQPSQPGDDSGVKIIIDGRTLDGQVEPVLKEGRLLVAMRPLFEALGQEVEWKPETKEVIARGKADIRLTLNSKKAVINGEEETLDVAPLLKEGRTMLPLRWIGENLDKYVAWDGEARTVQVYSK